MADFKTHITVSTALGVAYGAAAYKLLDMPAPTCVLAGTLCSVSGMLPDLDSDSGVPLRESLAFAAACVPMLLVDRFRGFGWSPETIVLAGAGIYFAIRFGIGKLLKKYTVHRGMFHSLPAAAIAGEAAFLLASGATLEVRAYKACAVVAGFMSHLLLDEIYSVKVGGVGISLKSSFGTAVKLWGSSGWANLSCYGKLAALSALVFNDPIWTDVTPEAHQIAQTFVGEVEKRTNVTLPEGPISWLGTTAPGARSSPTPTNPPTAATTPAVNDGRGNVVSSYPPSGGTPTSPGATIYASPSYPPATYAPPPGYATPPQAPAQYVPPPQYQPPANYGIPPGYATPPTYAPQPYVPPYVQPHQAQWQINAPYDSPRY